MLKEDWVAMGTGTQHPVIFFLKAADRQGGWFNRVHPFASLPSGLPSFHTLAFMHSMCTVLGK